MLIKTRNQSPIVSPGGFTPSVGPRSLQQTRVEATSATFAGVYMRPNIDNGGTVPAGGALCTCPDIWIANQEPIYQPQTTLATSSSYASSSSANVTHGVANYIYVRGYNNTAVTQNKTVQLYYVPSGIINWPGQWQGNVINTDQNQAQALITNAPSQAVCVADQVFVWNNPPPPPAGSDHYCLMAQFNDAQNSNPFPDITSSFDMGTLVTNNLGWGWRNTTFVNGNAQMAYTIPLTIPVNIVAPGDSYLVYVTPTGYKGWGVQFSCSQTDENGNQISLGSNPVAIQADGQVIGVQVKLAPGFNALMTVSLYGNGSPPVGAKLPLSCAYQATSQAEVTRAYALGLVDHRLMHAVLRGMRGTKNVTPTALIGLGANTWQIGQLQGKSQTA